jgi:formylglycine-generating enzyme required for sulfatase activity
VGSDPQGAGNWGHQDLAGNVMEWTLDWDTTYPSAASADYASLGQILNAGRVTRGGSWYNPAVDIAVAFRLGVGAPQRGVSVGFRCARAL